MPLKYANSAGGSNDAVALHVRSAQIIFFTEVEQGISVP